MSFKVNGNLRLNLNRFAVEIIRLISPLPHRLEGSGREHIRAAQHFWTYDAAFLVDGRLDQHRALRVRCERIPRILRFHALDEQSLRYAL